MASTGELTRTTHVTATVEVGGQDARRSLALAVRQGTQIAAALVALWIAGTFALTPRWPTPDLLLIFATATFGAFGQGVDLLKRLAPFSVLLIAYDSFRGLVPHLNTRVHYDWMIRADQALFRTDQLPTARLQEWLWHGGTSWYDRIYYGTYMSHFVFPALIVVLAWKLRPHAYRYVVACYLTLTTAAFVTFLAFPAAPPWLAAQEGVIPPIVRVSDHAFVDMTTVWSQVAPNPVAAVPSLHAGYAALFVILLWQLFGARWAAAAVAYPLVIFVGTVYAGEHYAIDEILGILYAVAAVVVVRVVGVKLEQRRASRDVAVHA